MPSIPKIKGRSKIAIIWKTNVRRKEITAEVRPSLRAVKKPEPKIVNPMNRKDKAKIRNPDTVRFISAES